MTKTFKTILGLILAWALVAQSGISTLAQTPTLTTLQNAATATGNGTPLNINGPAGNPANTLGAAGIQLIGSGTWVVTFEVTTDGTNWTAAMATNMADDVRDTTASAAGHYTILYGSAVSVRARVSSYTSGSVTAKGRLIPGLVSRVASSGGGGGGGSGDVVGPASATDNAIARFNLTTGKLIQDSVVTIADSTGDMAGVGTVNTHTIPGGTDTFTMNAATQTLSNKTFVAPALGTPASGVATNLTGTAAGLTAGAAAILSTPRTINGTSFDGSANITVTAAAGTLTGATLNSGVTASSLTSFGSSPTVVAPTISGAISFPDDVLQTFNPGTTNAGLNVGSLAGDPSTPSNGSLWYDSTANELTARINGANVALGAGGGGTPGGSTTQLQYNNAGAFGGISGLTTNGSTTLTQTSNSATAFESGPNGGTNPVFRLVNNVASAATGLSITGNAAGSRITLTALSSGSNEGISLVAKGTGTVSVPTQNVQIGTTTKTPPFGRGLYIDNTSGFGELVVDGSTGQGGLITMRKNGTSEWFWQLTSANDLQFTEAGVAAAIYFLNGSSLGIGDSAAVGTSGTKTLVIKSGNAPTSSPADEFQLYSADAAAGAANAYIRNEAGEINRISGLSAINTSAFSKTSDTTLANITGLTRPVEAGRTYAFRAELDATAAVTGGVKFAVSGTATATSISYSGVLIDGTTILANTRATALDTTVCASTTSTAGTCTIKGVVVINSGGTLTIQFAQNASDGSASTVLVNQSLQLIPIS